MSTARLKRAFVMPFFAFLGLVGIHSLWRVVTTGFAPVWVGPLVVVAWARCIGPLIASSNGMSR